MTAARTAGHSAKHIASRKHATTRKHNPSGAKTAATRKARVTAKGKHPGHAKARGFAGTGLLPACAAEAVAMSLRLAGHFVHDDEVAGLWELTGALPLGATLAATLDAAREHGLAGFRPQGMRLERLRPIGAADHVGLPLGDDEAGPLHPFEHFIAGHALILGVDVPGPHCVLATPDGWWSWGKLWSPWPCRVEEAWAVSWS